MVLYQVESAVAGPSIPVSFSSIKISFLNALLLYLYERFAFEGVYMDISMYNIWIDSIISMKKLPPYKYALPRTVNETEKSSEKSIHQDSHRFFIAVLFTVMTFIGCHVKLILNV